jgi:PAS domain S-box-containing protein
VELSQATEQLQQETAERQRTRQALEASERQYRLLAEHVADGLGIIQDGKLAFVNKSLATIFTPVERTSLLGSRPADLIRDDYRTSFAQLLAQTERDAAARQFQVPSMLENGKTLWVEGDLSLMEWEGKPALLMTVRDITDRKFQEIASEQEKKRLQKEIRTLKTMMKDRYRFGEIIGKSAVMQEVYAQMLQAAATDASVFIYGESGTGKELVARTIHTMSRRRDQRFIPVNCGAIPESLFESEFFGHRKGAFTGALRDKQGFFSVAHKGTLFLDELGELTPTMQVKLLRVLDDGEYIPIGETSVKKVDVRIIAATNRNIDDLRKRGLIREDFFFRIHVFTITIPPLRDHKEDIPLLVDHFLQRYETGQQASALPADIMERFYQYDWPGNVREFQNALQRYLSGQPLHFLESPASRTIDLSTMPASSRKAGTQEFHEVMEDFEKKLILNVLEQHRWNKSKTAALLGIPRRTLYRKMEKYGID